MPSRLSGRLSSALTFAAVLLILKVTVEVIAGYHHYLPPNFDSDFLRGRRSYFFESYQWAFYAHIASGPLSLFLGLILLSDRFRQRHLRWHRRLGRLQAVCVLLVVAPSGLWMARDAAAGPIAGAGFAILSLLTGATIAMGWRSAVARRFAEHRRWMTRNFLLLSSAVVIRILGGLATVLGVQSLWFDPITSWASWLAPLAIYEASVRRRMRRNPREREAAVPDANAPVSATR